MAVISLNRPWPARGFCFVVVLWSATWIGCDDDNSDLRNLRTQRQTSQRAGVTEVNHLDEAFKLIDRLVTLNPQSARRQILFHLGRWNEQNAAVNTDSDDGSDDSLPERLRDVSDVVSIEELRQRHHATTFGQADVDELRDAYLHRQIVAWVDRPGASDDPLLIPWLSTLPDASEPSDVGGRGGRSIRERLTSAARIFDWFNRNVAGQPLNIQSPIAPPDLPDGLVYNAPGYRQSPFQTLFRGSGDWWSRSLVFIRLLRQANLHAAILATTDASGGQPTPWCVGVLVDEQLYLFDVELGVHIPGPGGVGIATLDQARSDASVLRRMRVPGFFDYRLTGDDVRRVVALLDVSAESASERMRSLETSLTGRSRLVAWVDVSDLAARIDEVRGVTDVRVWSVPHRVNAYRVAVDRAADRDPQLAYLERTAWMMVESDAPMARRLATGRWRQLLGQFDDDANDNRPGARTLLLQQRSPEFEIEDLRTDPTLQRKYNFRRMLGVDSDDYDRQIQFVQQLIRATKRTATYWIATLQYDDAMYDNAASWLNQRVLDDDQRYIWDAPAHYNLARAYEKLGRVDDAVAMYKTVGLPGEQGHRIRARLLEAQ